MGQDEHRDALHAPVEILARPGRVVIGHRGASARAPENTVVAMELAGEDRADSLEFDVRVTRDGVPVIIHDATTGRTCEEDLEVRAHDHDRLQALDAGFRFSQDQERTYPFRGAGCGIPTLADILDRFPAMPILLELKTSEGQGEVRRVLDRHRAWQHVMVASAIHGAVRCFRDGVYRRAATRREIGWWYARALAGGRPRAPGYQALSIPPRKGMLHLAGVRPLAAARRAGLAVHVWTIDAPTEAARLWRAGVTGIITNAPDRMVPLRGREVDDHRN